MNNALWVWRKDLSYLFISICIVAIISQFIGYFVHMLVLILSFVIIKQSILLRRLERWLSTGAGGKIPEGTGIWGDIYQHFYKIKKAEKKRKKSLGVIIDQYRKSTDVLPDAAVVLRSNNEIDWSNKLAKLVLGIKKRDKGQRVDNLIRAPEFIAFLRQKKDIKNLIMPSPIDEGIILQFRMVNYGRGQNLVIAHDITQQTNMELMRKNFVDNVSHELRTPLTVLKGYLETLQEVDDNQSVILSKSLLQMQSQTDRMQYLVDDLLLLARLETKPKRKDCVDISQLITEICAEIKGLEENFQRVELNLESNIKILGEEQELRSVFTNLIGNALKYSDDNTVVKVNWKNTKEGSCFEVIDKGEGIARKDIDRITERFYRVEGRRRKKVVGTGLGLAIVKHVLIRHEAALEITSKLRQGSKFRCVFPESRIC